MSEQKLIERISKIEQRLASLEKNLSVDGEPVPQRRMLNTEEAARFLGMTIDGLWNLTRKKLIPFYKPNGKNMYFDVDELSAWQKKNHFEPVDAIRR